MEATKSNSTLAGSDEMLTEAEAAEMLGLVPKTLNNWRQTKRCPELKYIKVGRRSIRYRRADVQAFLDSGKSD